MNFQHKEAAAGRWYELSLVEQMANIGSEVFRAIKWKNKADLRTSQLAFERALELCDLTLADPKNIGRLREVARTREFLVDYFFGDNLYGSSDANWEKYFYAFNYAARIGK
jgi:hypothetical protein